MSQIVGNGISGGMMTDFGNAIENKINIKGDSDFLKLVNGKDQSAVLPIIDELMEAVKILHPRMFNSVIDRISKI